MAVKIERKSDWAVRKAAMADKEVVLSLFRQTTWKQRDADVLYAWKFERNPSGRAVIYLGVNTQNQVVANSVFMPWRLCFDGQIIEAHQWVDMIIQLEYRGQALSTALLREAIIPFWQRGKHICFAFPNNNGVMVHKQNNGYLLGNLMRYTKPLDTGYILSRKIKNAFLLRIATGIANFLLSVFSGDFLRGKSSYEFRAVESCGKEFDALWSECLSLLKGKVIVEKSAAYLQWKYLESPGKKRILYGLYNDNNLRAFAVLEEVNGVGHMVDFLAPDEIVTCALLESVIRLSRKKSLISLVFVALENNYALPVLGRLGFVHRPGEKQFYIYLSEDFKKDERLQRPENWVISIGDCDIECL